MRDYLGSVHPNEAIIEPPTPVPIYGDLFLLDSDVPTAFSYEQWPAGWCTADFNCFSHLHEFADSLSERNGLRVVVLNVQTTSCCYYVALHENGIRRRAFNYEDGEWTLQSGEPLAFEAENPLCEHIRESQVDAFCGSLGLPIGSRENYPKTWHTIQLANQPDNRRRPIARPNVPWWKRLFRR